MVREVYSWLKTAGFNQGFISMIKTGIDVFLSEVDELKVACLNLVQNGDINKDEDLVIDVLDGLADVQFSMFNLPYFLWLEQEDVERFEQAVIESNWSKFCDNEDDAKETVGLYRIGEHPDKKGIEIECYYLKQNNKFVIYRKSDNKVMKNYKYIPAKDIYLKNKLKDG